MLYRIISGLALLVCAAVPLRAQAPDTLRLSAIFRELRAQNPTMKAAAALVDAERAREPAAGLPPDPEVLIGVLEPAAQVMQMLPFPGKRSLSRTIARQSTSIAQSRSEEKWWEVRARAAMAFYEVYEADRQLEVMNETLALLRRFQTVAQAMYSAGEGRQTDVLRAGVEIARMRADSTRMQTMRTVAAARLNALLNRAADAPVAATKSPPLPVRLPPLDTLRVWAAAERPMIAAARTAIAQAQTREALARREIWPDLTIGAQYGQRATEMGTENMGGLMFGFTVPIFAKQRQLRMRDEASAMKQMAQLELIEMQAGVNARITQLVAEAERARTLIDLFARDVLPQANATVESAFSSYRVGAVDFMTLVDAQMTTNKYRQELVTLEAQFGVALAELEMTVGREMQP